MPTDNIEPPQVPAPHAPTTTKRRSFYVSDDLWYKFQSKLWSDRNNASRWIREMMEWYIADKED